MQEVIKAIVCISIGMLIGRVLHKTFSWQRLRIVKNWVCGLIFLLGMMAFLIGLCAADSTGIGFWIAMGMLIGGLAVMAVTMLAADALERWIDYRERAHKEMMKMGPWKDIRGRKLKAYGQK